MPSFVDAARCDGCPGLDQARCESICPLDLMSLDRDAAMFGRHAQARNRAPDECSECYACVKACPRQAVAVRHYADLVALGARVQPFAAGDALSWTVTLRDGTEKHLGVPVRTRPEPPGDPYAGLPLPDLTDLARPGLFNTGSDGLQATDPAQLIRT
jgi:adenylylsulfate reductase, subunit B